MKLSYCCVEGAENFQFPLHNKSKHGQAYFNIGDKYLSRIIKNILDTFLCIGHRVYLEMS